MVHNQHALQSRRPDDSPGSLARRFWSLPAYFLDAVFANGLASPPKLRLFSGKSGMFTMKKVIAVLLLLTAVIAAALVYFLLNKPAPRAADLLPEFDPRLS